MSVVHRVGAGLCHHIVHFPLEKQHMAHINSLHFENEKQSTRYIQMNTNCPFIRQGIKYLMCRLYKLG